MKRGTFSKGSVPGKGREGKGSERCRFSRNGKVRKDLKRLYNLLYKTATIEGHGLL